MLCTPSPIFRSILDTLATQVWEIVPDEVVLHEFDSTYTEYRLRQEAQRTVEGASKIHATCAQKAVRNPVPPEEKRRKRRLQDVEKQIHALEEHLAVLGRQLENPPADPGRVERLGGEYVQVTGQLEIMMSEWEMLTDNK